MRSKLPVVSVQIGSPCEQRADDMATVNGERFCESCNKPVFDMREATAMRAAAILTLYEKPCMQIRRDHNGAAIWQPKENRKQPSLPLLLQPQPLQKIAFASGMVAMLTFQPAASAEPVRTPAGLVQGKVESDDGEPLEAATVLVRKTNGETATEDLDLQITDEKGRYQLSPLEPGEYVLTLLYAGHEIRRGHVIVKDNTTTVVDFRLRSEDIGTEVVGGISDDSEVEQSKSSWLLMNGAIEELATQFKMMPGDRKLVIVAGPTKSWLGKKHGANKRLRKIRKQLVKQGIPSSRIELQYDKHKRPDFLDSYPTRSQ